MKNKNILFIGTNLGLGSGHAKPALLLANQLKKSGFSVSVLTNQGVKEKLPKEVLEREDLVDLDIAFTLNDLASLRKAVEKADTLHFFDLLTFLRIKKKVQLDGKTLYYSLNAPLKPSFLDVKTLGLSGFRALLTKNTAKAALLPRFVYRSILNHFDTVFSWSKIGMTWLEHMGVDKKRIDYLPMPVNLVSLKQQKPQKKKSLTYGYFGWASQIRGTKDVFKAFLPLKNSGHTLKMHVRAIRSSEKNILTFAKKNACKAIDFQVCNYKNINEFLDQCDVMVLPFRASFCVQPPLVVLESMGAGVPVVSAHSSSIPEVIENGKTGVLAPVKDIEGLTKAIQSVEDFEFRRTLSGNARKYILEEHSPQKVAEEYCARITND